MPEPTNYYSNHQDHLLDELHWLNKLIAMHILELRKVNFYNNIKDLRGFFIADDEIDALLAAGVFENIKFDDKKRNKLIRELRENSQRLCQEIDQRIQFLHNFDASAPLRYFRLIESLQTDSAASANQRFFRADNPILNYVLGNQTIDSSLIPQLHFYCPLRWDEIIISKALQDQLKKLFRLNDLTNHSPIFYLYRRPGVGKKTLARALCGEAGIGLAVVDMRSLLKTPENYLENMRLTLREALLQPCGLYLDHLEKLESEGFENSSYFNGLIQELRQLSWSTFLGSENPLPGALLELKNICTIKIPAPDYSAQK